MDLIDEAKLQAAGEVLISKLNTTADEVVDRGIEAIGVQLNSTTLQLSNILNGVLTGIQAIEDKAKGDLQALILGLDGWTLDIKVTLRKPGN